MKKKVFEYVVVHQDDNEARIIVGPDVLLATNRETAQMQVVRMIPEDYMSSIDDLDIIIRPFA
jgi:hypothetical protein